MTDSPFTLLTFIAAPAILTNASSVLALNTANRYGRAFDRTKEISEQLDLPPVAGGDDLRPFRVRLIQLLIARAGLLLRAQTCFYVAIGLFVLSALVSLVGSAMGLERTAWVRPMAVTGLGIGVLATSCLVLGCVLTVKETQLAMTSLREEETRLLERRRSW